VCTQSNSVQIIHIAIFLNKVHDIHIDGVVTVSNSEVFSKLLDVDNHDEDVDSAFGDGDVTREDISNCN
jgi:hypothetical protein